MYNSSQQNTVSQTHNQNNLGADFTQNNVVHLSENNIVPDSQLTQSNNSNKFFPDTSFFSRMFDHKDGYDI